MSCFSWMPNAYWACLPKHVYYWLCAVDVDYRHLTCIWCVLFELAIRHTKFAYAMAVSRWLLLLKHTVIDYIRIFIDLSTSSYADEYRCRKWSWQTNNNNNNSQADHLKLEIKQVSHIGHRLVDIDDLFRPHPPILAFLCRTIAM